MLKIIPFIVAAGITVGFTSAFAQTEERATPEQSFHNNFYNHSPVSNRNLHPDIHSEPLRMAPPPPRQAEPPLSNEQGGAAHSSGGGSGPLGPDQGGTNYTAP